MAEIYDARTMLEGLQGKVAELRKEVASEAGLSEETRVRWASSMEALERGQGALQEKLVEAMQTRLREEYEVVKEAYKKDTNVEWGRLLRLVDELQGERMDLQQSLAYASSQLQALEAESVRLSSELASARDGCKQLSEQLARSQQAEKTAAAARDAATVDLQKVRGEWQEMARRLNGIDESERLDKNSEDNWRAVHNAHIGVNRACMLVGSRAGEDGTNPLMLEEAYAESRSECERLRKQVNLLTAPGPAPGGFPAQAAPDQDKIGDAAALSRKLQLPFSLQGRQQHPQQQRNAFALQQRCEARPMEGPALMVAGLPKEPEDIHFQSFGLNLLHTAVDDPLPEDRTIPACISFGQTTAQYGAASPPPTAMQQAANDEPWARIKSMQLGRIESELSGLKQKLLGASGDAQH